MCVAAGPMIALLVLTALRIGVDLTRDSQDAKAEKVSKILLAAQTISFVWLLLSM